MKKLFIFMLLFIISLCAFGYANFGSNFTIRENEYHKEAFLFGSNGTIDGKVKKVYLFGGNLYINGEAEDIYNFGGNIIVNGSVTGKINDFGGRTSYSESTIKLKNLLGNNNSSNFTFNFDSTKIKDPLWGAGRFLIFLGSLFNILLTFCLYFIFKENIDNLSNMLTNNFKESLSVGLKYFAILILTAIILVVSIIGIALLPFYIFLWILLTIIAAPVIYKTIGDFVLKSKEKPYMSILTGIGIVFLFDMFLTFTGFFIIAVFKSLLAGIIIKTRFGNRNLN